MSRLRDRWWRWLYPGDYAKLRAGMRARRELGLATKPRMPPTPGENRCR